MQKKSLISTLKPAKKANIAAAPAKKEGGSTRKNLPKTGLSGKS
jgi:hypothetical protein